MTLPLNDVLQFLEEFAPLDLAESWDNVGLLLGETDSRIERVMTCLTLSPDVADEAVSKGTNLVVSHHPILFRAVQKLTSRSSEGAMILKLIRAGVAVYSPHTAFDSARQGINQQLAETLGLQEIRPLRPSLLPGREGTGAGRWGVLPTPMHRDEFLERVRQTLKVNPLPVVGSSRELISSVAVACGSAGEFLPDALAVGCDLFLTGETRFHTFLEARDREIALILPGHYATERLGIERLATILAKQFPALRVWASEVESDPLSFSTGARS